MPFAAFSLVPLPCPLSARAARQPPAAAPKYDLLLRGGHVIDARNKISAVRDVAIAGGKIAAVAAKIDPADAVKTVDVSGLYVTPGLIDIHAHTYTGTGERRSYAGDNSVYPDGFTFRVGVTTVADAGCAGWRNFEDFKQRVIDRSKTRILAFLNIVGNGMRGGTYEQDLADMEAKPTADMALRFPGLIVGIKTAHYSGPEWAPVERAVEAGTLANMPVMVDFGSNKPERPMSELVTKKLRPGDIYTHVYSGLRGELDPSGHVNPGTARGPEARRDLRRRPRRRQLPLAHRGAGDEGRIPARLDLDRPAHRQHERRHEGHAQRDGQVPRDGHAARRRDRAVDVESGARDQAGRAGPSVGRRASRTSRCCASRRARSDCVDMNGARMEATERLMCELTVRDGKVVYDLNGISRPDWRTLAGQLRTNRRRTMGRAESGPRCSAAAAARPGRRAGCDAHQEVSDGEVESKSVPEERAGRGGRGSGGGSGDRTRAGRRRRSRSRRCIYRSGKPPEKPPLFNGTVLYGNLVFISGIGAHDPRATSRRTRRRCWRR